jgi:hypothetical protein
MSLLSHFKNTIIIAFKLGSTHCVPWKVNLCIHTYKHIYLKYVYLTDYNYF